ncbi:TRF-like 2, putative isoform 2 [Theobroma cacao]|uniref:TRF-like 2, putative isoform 2 n=1 Tax=Theobroma cacao TaxID=3641 RepID=A0A061GVW7_THECC|nr:TRF-like 2, putative isoform 2 [Theobroma cacao]
MVLQKRLDYGFNGYRVPATPRATRSARKRVPFRKRFEDNQISAFDLLATVAGNLLLGKESTPTSSNKSSGEDQSAVVKNTVKEERRDGDQSLKVETSNQDRTDRKFFVSELVPQTNDLNYSSKESPSLQNDAHFGFASVITTSDCSERYDAQKLMNGKTENEMGSFPCKVETGPFVCGTSGDCIKPESQNKGLMYEELDRTDKISIGEVADTCPLEDPVLLDGKPPALVSSDDSGKARSCGDCSPRSSFPAKQDDVNVVRDDNKTLLQTGISRDNQMDALGFSLEPNPSQTSPLLCRGGSPLTLPCDSPLPLARYPTTPRLANQVICDPSPLPHMANLGNFVESDHDSAPSPTDMSLEKSTTDSKALVAVPAMSVEALAVVPAHRKSKRSEVVQRRIRRPFSVAEVEALVQAVEKLGTGRWRDVKLRAFDNAKHRTYVDLKDKWKTLVHTARISPQQRRGEPVPQELLDRVLTAHAYWSQQQAKQQLKPQQPETCLLLYNSTIRGGSTCDVVEKTLG